MAVSKAKKTEQVEKLGQELQKVSSVIVSTYSKLTVAQDFELRKTLRSSGAKYRVVKNTLAERAAKGTKVAAVLKGLTGVHLHRLHRRRSGGLGQGAFEVRQGQSGIYLQGRSGRRPRHHDQRDRGRWRPCRRRKKSTPSCCSC